MKNILIGLLIASCIWACDKSSGTRPDPPPIVKKTEFKVLFVGNSYTYYNDGVDFHLEKMLKAEASSDSISYDIQKVAKGSYTLQAHFGDLETLDKIKNNAWNTVVLQEQSTRPINNPALFLEYATKLDQEIKKINAKTVLYMTWATKDNPGDINELAASYISVGKQISADVEPVGRVWEYAFKTYPQVNLYQSDNKHPTLEGTYLIACVFYNTLFNKNPKDNTYVPAGMTNQDAVVIRKAVFDYLAQEKNYKR